MLLKWLHFVSQSWKVPQLDLGLQESQLSVILVSLQWHTKCVFDLYIKRFELRKETALYKNKFIIIIIKILIKYKFIHYYFSNGQIQIKYELFFISNTNTNLTPSLTMRIFLVMPWCVVVFQANNEDNKDLLSGGGVCRGPVLCGHGPEMSGHRCNGSRPEPRKDWPVEFGQSAHIRGWSSILLPSLPCVPQTVKIVFFLQLTHDFILMRQIRILAFTYWYYLVLVCLHYCFT